MRTKSWLNNSSVVERAAVMDARSQFKEKIPTNSPLQQLQVPVSDLKKLLSEASMEKAMDMACSGEHVRYCFFLYCSVV